MVFDFMFLGIGCNAYLAFSAERPGLAEITSMKLRSSISNLPYQYYVGRQLRRLGDLKYNYGCSQYPTTGVGISRPASRVKTQHLFHFQPRWRPYSILSIAEMA
jgi:hypothetical protein